MRKKSSIAICMALCMLMAGTVASAYMGNSASVTLTKNDKEVKSNTIGSGGAATYNVANSKGSGAAIEAQVYAQWVGWPFTLEYTGEVPIGQSREHTEKQSFESNFYLGLEGNKKCNGNGTIKLAS